MTLVSVIIPNYNHARFLAKRISSVLEQTYIRFELIILDDSSTDNSREVIDSFLPHPNISRVIINERNSGSTFHQWKKGLEIATGDLIWIAESDDYCKADFLEFVCKAFEDPQMVLAYARSIDVDENNNELGLSYQHLEWGNHSFVKEGSQEIFEHLYYQCTIPNVSAVVFKKSAVNLSYFGHGLKLCGDWYFYLKLLQKGKIAYISTPLNFHRFHSKSVRSTEVKNLKLVMERLSIVKEIRKDCNFSYFKYLKSANRQIELFIIQTPFKALFSLEFWKAVKAVCSINMLFAFMITTALVSKKVFNKIYHS